MNGLAGPLHGLANQEVLTWLMKVHSEHETFTEQQLHDFVWETLKTGVSNTVQVFTVPIRKKWWKYQLILAIFIFELFVAQLSQQLII